MQELSQKQTGAETQPKPAATKQLQNKQPSQEGTVKPTHIAPHPTASRGEAVGPKTGPRFISLPPGPSRSGSTSSNSSGLSTSSDASSGPVSTHMTGFPRVTKYSHKLAERRRRREMKNVFDRLNDLLPLTDGKRSKWDVLVDAHNFIDELLATQKIYKEERERLRNEIEALGKNHK